MKPIQNKIIKITDEYIKRNYKEYCAVCESLKDKRQIQQDEFASTKGKNYINQLAIVIPESLDNLLQSKLEDDEWRYFKSKQGVEWYANRFKEFSPITRHD